MSITTILDRIAHVRQTGPGRWLARCPAHEDRSPSLAIRELDDGRILLHDFGGCSVDDILGALGLAMRDLYPEPLPGTGPARTHSPSHSRIPARDLLAVLSEETDIVAIIAAEFLAQRVIAESDWQRLAQAAARIGRARDHVR